MPPLDLEADGKADLDVKADGKDFMLIPSPSTSPTNPWKEFAKEGTSEPSDPGIDRTPKLFIGENKRDRTVAIRILSFPRMASRWGSLDKVTEKT